MSARGLIPAFVYVYMQVTSPVSQPPKSPATIETIPKQTSTNRKSYVSEHNY